MTNYKEIANTYRTPVFLIDIDRLKNNFKELQQSCPGSQICYSQKTNQHPAIVKQIIKLGGLLAVSSTKELQKVLEQGVCADKILYHPIAENIEELEYAISQNTFLLIANSISELKKINSVLKKSNKKLQLGLRINVESLTNQYIPSSKFGLHVSEIPNALEVILSNNNILLTTLCCHIGTNILTPSLYGEVYRKLCRLNIDGITKIDIGGGFPSNDTLIANNLTISNYFDQINKKIKSSQSIILEPGRFLIEDACFCITKVLSINHKWVILDISSNFLPPLKNSDYKIETEYGPHSYNFAGRLCFGADVIKNDVKSEYLEEGDTILIKKCGSYTYSMKNVMGYNDPTILIKDNDKLTVPPFLSL